MTKKIPQKTVAKILWDYGIHRPASIERLSGIAERTVRRFIKEFNEGGDQERKAYKPRRKPSQTPEKVRKVVSKARDRKQIHSLKDISRKTGVNRETVRSILKDKGFKYSTYKKKLFINEETKQSRLALARRMVNRESDWDTLYSRTSAAFG